MAQCHVMCEGGIITGYIVSNNIFYKLKFGIPTPKLCHSHNNFKKKRKINKYFLTLPVILVLVIRATIKITWSCFIIHHAEVFQVWKAHGYSLYKSAQICNFIVVYPQNVK